MIVGFDSNGKATIEGLPRGYIVDVVVIDKVNDNYMWAKKRVRIGTTESLNVRTGRISEASLKRELRKLDQWRE